MAKDALLRALAGEPLSPPPIWIMRQAGRYLPEYKAIRRAAGSFLDLCLTPELAAEVSLQPIRRFDFDAAILFSDILIVPHALGQTLTFEDGVGPMLSPLPDNLEDLALADAEERLTPVFETVQRVRAELAAEKALIGFCGAPWTVATYMIAGRGSPDQFPARDLALRNPARMQQLIDILVEASVRYLTRQIEAGADAVKLFDTWAGILDEEGFERWSIAPIRRITEALKRAHPSVPVIAFPRGAGARIVRFSEATGVDAVAVDWTLPMALARDMVQGRCVLQGNLDPLRLVVGGKALAEGIDAVLAAMRGRAHIFNLGHGITPDTPIEHVEQLVRRVRSGT